MITSRPFPRIAGLSFVLALVLLPAPAPASENTTLYGVSGSSFRKVGTLDRELSQACRQGTFNQVRKDRLYIGYFGPGGGRRTLTGIARQDFNLSDPAGRAEPDTTYHFHNDGYSDCLVFVARVGDPPNPR